MGRLPQRILARLTATFVLALFIASLAPPAFAAVSFGEPRQLLNTPDFGSAVAWSPDGTKVLFGFGFSIDSPSKFGIARTDFPVYNIVREGIGERAWAWSPDGSQFSFTAPSPQGDTLWVANADGSGARPVAGSESGVGGFIMGGSWTADGRLVYFGRTGDSGPQVIASIPVMGGMPTTIAEAQSQPNVSPDGTKVAFLDISMKPRVVDLLGVSPDVVFGAGAGATARTAPSWSHNGAKVLWLAEGYAPDGSLENYLWVANADGSGAPLLALKSTQRIWTAALSADGSYVGYLADDPALPGMALYVAPASGGAPARFEAFQPTGPGVLWSPVGSQLAVGSGNALYTVDVTGDVAPAAPHTTVLIDAYREWQDWIHYTATISFATDQPGMTYHQWDSQDPSGWTFGPVPVNTMQGYHTLYYYTDSMDGRVEPVQSKVIGIDGIPPTPPVVIRHEADGSGGYVVEWNPSLDDGAGVSHYEFWDGGTYIGRSYGLSYRATGLDLQRSHIFNVIAVDYLGNGASTRLTYEPAPKPATLSLDHGVKLDFDSLVSGGASAADVAAGDRHAAPASWRLLTGSYYEIAVTGSFSGGVQVTVPYSDADLGSADESGLRLYHWTGGGWQDITGSVDTANNTITGRTTSFSPFAVAAPAEAPPVVSTPASSGWSAALFALALAAALPVVRHASGARARRGAA